MGAGRKKPSGGTIVKEKSCLEQRKSLVLNKSYAVAAAKGQTLRPSASSGLLPAEAREPAQCRLPALLIWFPKYYILPFCLGGAVKHVTIFHLFILRRPRAVTPTQGGDGKMLPGSDVLGAPLSQQDPWKTTGHPSEVGSHAKPETPSAQLAYFSAALSRESF